MSDRQDPAAVPAAPPEPPKTWRVGNLIYDRKGLFYLFMWLLWFDFCYMLMEHVLHPILQVRLQNELHCNNVLFKVFLSTVPAVLNFFLNPIVSIKSDRHRGPRGRRVPFLLWGAPLVCGVLILIGFGNELSAWVHDSYFPKTAVDTVTIYTFGTLFIAFFAANMFLGTTYFYLFNDVVPKEHQVKFMSYLRAVSTLAGMCYSWFIYGYINTWAPIDINLGLWHYHSDYFWYPKLILIGASLFYIVAATVALLKIKEPEYPPPPPLPEGQKLFRKWAQTVQILVRECFSHRLYVLYFITLTINCMAAQMDEWQTPMRVALGMDLMFLGKVGAVTGAISFVLILLTAGYGDRFRPLPLMVVAMCTVVLTAPLGLLFLIPGLSSHQYLWIQIGYSLAHIPVNLVLGMAHEPLGMSLLPRERFGQFCAAQSMMRMVFGQFAGGLIAGVAMQWLQSVHGGTSFYLRYALAWKMGFQILVLVCFIILYFEWKKLGGRDHYKPPPVRPAEAKT